MAERERIMVISHGHPSVSPGGGENVAYALFNELRQRPDVDALFVAREPRKAFHGAAIGQRTRDGSELLIRTDVEFFRFSQRHQPVVYRDFRSLLEWFRPTVVHFQHFIHLGLELLREVRNYSASVPIVLTLHEYLAICHNNGQMVKVPDLSLCMGANPDDCHRCFPQYTPQDFFLRESYIKSFFSLVDAFVAPSDFLAQRYVEWGLPAERIARIENGLPHAAQLHREEGARPGTRFGFFGQIHPFKGLDVLLEAMVRLSKSSPRVTLDIHGSRLSEQHSDYQDRIRRLLARVGEAVTLHGPYVQADLPRLMGTVDWVVIPSKWWENSPVVIAEAFANGRPVICSGVGGMAEKVRDGVDGLHFRLGDAEDLAARMREAASTPGLLEQLVRGIPKVPSAAEMADQHLALYERLVSQRASGKPAA